MQHPRPGLTPSSNYRLQAQLANNAEGLPTWQIRQVTGMLPLSHSLNFGRVLLEMTCPKELASH